MPDTRKPWEIPIQYTDDRWTPTSKEQSRLADIVASEENRHIDDVEEILDRPDSKEERAYDCNDTSPVNYGHGPHDDEFGVDDEDTPDTDLVPYDRGPENEEEFGVDDDDFEAADDDDQEFEEDVY